MSYRRDIAMTDPNTTANLVNGITEAYRQHAAADAARERDLGMVIRSLSADGVRDVLLTLADREPDLVSQALDDCAATWDPDSPDALAVVREG